MAYVLRKGSRFMTGHSYATGYGYSFSWSSDESKARRFSDTDASVDTLIRHSRAKLEHRKNLKHEIRALGKERVELAKRAKVVPHPVDARINERAIRERESK